MRVYNIHDKTRTLSEKIGTPLSRRRFVKNVAIFTTLYLLPLSACKRLFHSDESRPGKYVLSNKEKEILAAVQEHLFPDDGEGPGAQKINALHHYRFVLSDKHLDDWVRKVLLSGMKWVNDTAQEFYKKDFTSLYAAEKEHVLRDLETYKNGKWKGESNYDSGWDFWNGSMVGGSSNLMSGYFHRLKPVDFRLQSEFGPIDGAHVADWPISYEELEPFYTMTESVVGISGRVVQHPFLEPRSTSDYPYPPLVEHPVAALIDEASKKLGYHSLPTARAILSRPGNNRNSCSYSGYCGSYGCATGAKGSSRAALLDHAVRAGNCEIRPNSQVYKLESDSKGKVTGVRYYTKEGKAKKLDAKIYVVACQAVESSRLLLLSTGPKFPDGLANNSGNVGKNLLFSAGGIGSAVFHADQFSPEEFAALRDIHLFVNRANQDWYVIDDPTVGKRMKGGTVDFLLEHANPIRRAQQMKWNGERLLWGKELKTKLHHKFLKTVQLNFEIFCDWTPNDNCFVSLSSTVKDKYGLPVAKIRVGYHPHDLVPGNYLSKKAEALMNEMRGNAIQSDISGSPPSNLMAGGCRFGDDPESSVLDKYCRAHEVENLFVTDGSFMPTGGSVPYTWTIYANAFRVSDQILKQC